MLLTAYTVAMLTYYATKIMIIGSPLAGHLHDMNIVIVSLDKQRYYSAVGKVQETVQLPASLSRHQPHEMPIFFFLYFL